MAIPQLNPASKMNFLVTKIIQKLSDPNKCTEAEIIFKRTNGFVAKSQLKRKIIERLSSIEVSACKDKNNMDLNAKNVNVNTLKSIPDFLKPTQNPRPVFKLPDRQKFLKTREAKWQLVSDNLAKMDSVILEEYKERRKDYKNKSKKTFPF